MLWRILALGCLLSYGCGGDVRGPGASDEGDGADGADTDGSVGDGDVPGEADGEPSPGEPDAGEVSMDAGPSGALPDAGAADGSIDTPNPDGTPGPLSECADGASIDRFQSWLASGEGTTLPATGSILTGSGDDVIGKVEFLNAEWHVVPVLAANRFEAQVDLSAASGFWLTYSATADLYVQLRPGFAWDGGDKYLTTVPSTRGNVETRFFPLDTTSWTTLEALGVPTYPYEEARAAVRGFVFVGQTPNVLEFHGLRVDGYAPPCL